ncbi:MAG: hypothetical protein AAB651_00150 [Patescibacteria group bacterium]
MHNFILQIVLMVSLGIMIYLIARAAPRIGDTVETAAKKSPNKLDRLIATLPIEKLDFIFSSFMEKTLRKLRVWFLKWDNLLTNHLNKFKKTNGEKEKNDLFGENNKELTNDEK